MRLAYQYRINYLEMLKDYQYSRYYEDIKDKINSFSNPIDFFNLVHKLKNSEFIEDIKYMYKTSEINKYLRELAIGLGVDLDENEEDYDEEGEEEE